MGLSILWLGRTLPLPLRSGDRVYSAKSIGAVARAGARVICLGLDNPDEPSGARDVLEPAVDWQLVPGGATITASRSLQQPTDGEREVCDAAVPRDAWSPACN